jgi:hypothetical protein
VVADLHRTTPHRPAVTVDIVDDFVVRIAIDGSFSTPSMSARVIPEAIAEVGEYFQEQLAQEIGCWPECDEHAAGLHAEVHDAIAVWWCRAGRHVASFIGELGSDDA